MNEHIERVDPVLKALGASTACTSLSSRCGSTCTPPYTAEDGGGLPPDDDELEDFEEEDDAHDHGIDEVVGDKSSAGDVRAGEGVEEEGGAAADANAGAEGGVGSDEPAVALAPRVDEKTKESINDAVARVREKRQKAISLRRAAITAGTTIAGAANKARMPTAAERAEAAKTPEGIAALAKQIKAAKRANLLALESKPTTKAAAPSPKGVLAKTPASSTGAAGGGSGGKKGAAEELLEAALARSRSLKEKG